MNIYEDIAKRTNGEIYLGVVGPVRSGKSTFVKKFLDTLVVPNIASEYDKERAKDESPQSASGKTIMTTEPKFIPDEAVSVEIGTSRMKMRLIDCVGYMVDGAIGGEENGEVRMVNTPWSKTPLEFEKAAELGTKKVIRDHSTIGVIVTTDGSIGELSRDSYEKAEIRVVKELQSIGKPFVIVLNSANPQNEDTQELARQLELKYGAPVALINATELSYEDFEGIIELLLSQFNITEIEFKLPPYISTLENNHWLKESLLTSIKESLVDVQKIDDIKKCYEHLRKNPYLDGTPTPSYDLGNGVCQLTVNLKNDLYYQVMTELCGVKIENDQELFNCIKCLSESKKEFDKFVSAIDEVNSTGYGIVLPEVEDMVLEEPEITKHGGNYGIKLKASAPSIHLIRASIETEINPIVGSADQSEEIIKDLLDEFRDDPKMLWNSKMFGKSLYELVNDGLHAKLSHISPESRTKLSDTLTRVINEGSNGLICIIL